MNINFTELFSDQLVEHFVDSGFTEFVSAPGGRSAALVRAVHNNSRANLQVHFDERGAGFYALGASKVTGKPSVLISTSGTALGNLMPAVIEAHSTRTPLIVLTADLPVENSGIGENQSIKQSGFFRDFSVWSVDLPEPGPELSVSLIQSVASRAISASAGGPVHINCRLGKPYLGKKSALESGCEGIKGLPNLEIGLREEELSRGKTVSDSDLENLASEISAAHRGLVLVGELPAYSDRELLKGFLRKLGWPVFTDIASGMREKDLYSCLALGSDSEELGGADFVLQFGGEFVSPIVKTLLSKNRPTRVLVNDRSPSQDPSRSLTKHLFCSPESVCAELPKVSKFQPRPSELCAWAEKLNSSFLKRTERALVVMEGKKEFSEALAVKTLSRKLSATSQLFLGNSLSIRVFEALALNEEQAKIITNRGVSGIDGLIATACGAASQALNHRTIALLGDQSALHDLNSLGLAAKYNLPVMFFIVNNSGGSIFSMLPELQSLTGFEENFHNSHSLNFSAAAEMFGLKYTSAPSKEEVEKAFDEFFQRPPAPMLLEVFVSQEGGVEFLKQLS